MGGLFNQVLATAAGSFGCLMMGIFTVWPSYTSSIYLAENNTILSMPMEEFELSLVGSLPSLGGMVGTFAATVLVETLGRKNGGIVIVLPMVVSWAVILVSSTPIPIFIARFIGGASGGASVFYAPLLISETAEDSIRGTLASGPVALYSLGALTSYLLGWFVSYHTIIWLNIVFGIFSIALIMTISETPLFLMKKKQEEEASKAIAYYRGVKLNSKIVIEELYLLKLKLMAPKLIAVKTFEPTEKDDVGMTNIEDDIYQEGTENRSPIKVLLTSSRQPFLVVSFFAAALVFMGIGPVQIHARHLFALAAPSLSPHFCSAILAVMMLAGSLTAGALVDVLGRKVLQLTSTSLVTIIMAALGYLIWSRAAPPWVSAVLLLSYCFCFNIGIGTVPFILLAEAFVPEVQGIASMIFIELMWFLSFLIVTVFPMVASVIGVHGTFVIFSMVAATTTVLTYFLLPETKGLTNDQIQDAFSKRSK